MAAKHKITKKIVKRKVSSKTRAKPIENTMPEQAPTVIPNVPVQPVQPITFSQPVQPVEPIVPAQPSQPVSPQPVPVSPQSPTLTPSSDEELEIKMGTGDKSTQAASDPVQVANTAEAVSEKSSAQPKDEALITEGIQNKSEEKKNFLLPILVVVLLGAAVLGGLFIYRENFTAKVEKKVNEVSLPPSPIEKATPEPLDLSKFEIAILNGSGIDGEASNQKSNLESAGFNVAAIGNADESNYTETVIQSKKDVDDAFLDKLKGTLEESFEVTTEELDEDAETDIVIIIGNKKAE